MRVLLTDTYLGEPSLERELLEANGLELVVAAQSDPASLSRYDVHGILNCIARIPAQVIDALPRLRMIVRYGIGVDNIDVPAATRRGVMVCNVPDYCIDEVSIHALTMVLACNRELVWYHETMRSGLWNSAPPVPLRRLTGRVLGVVGLGRIGQAVCRHARSLGMEVIAYDPAITPEEASRVGAEWTDWVQLLTRSDFVTVHVPFHPGARNLFDAETLAKMKPDAYLINTARGGLVDHDALLDALNAGQLAGAALDVFPEEPLPSEHPLRRHPRVILTPHVAWLSEEAREDSRRKAVETMIAGLKGREPASIVNRTDG